MLSWENDKFLEKCFEVSALCFPVWLGTWNFHPALTIPFLMSKLWLWYWLVMAIMVRASARCCPVSTVCVARSASGPSLDMEHRNTCRLLWRGLCAAWRAATSPNQAQVQVLWPLLLSISLHHLLMTIDTEPYFLIWIPSGIWNQTLSYLIHLHWFQLMIDIHCHTNLDSFMENQISIEISHSN